MKRVQIDPQKLRKVIKSQGIYYDWLAERAGISVSTLKRLLSGRIKTTGASGAIKMANQLQVPLHEILTEQSFSDFREQFIVFRSDGYRMQYGTLVEYDYKGDGGIIRVVPPEVTE